MKKLKLTKKKLIALVAVILILVLIIRPNGLFGKKGITKV